MSASVDDKASVGEAVGEAVLVNEGVREGVNAAAAVRVSCEAKTGSTSVAGAGRLQAGRTNRRRII